MHKVRDRDADHTLDQRDGSADFGGHLGKTEVLSACDLVFAGGQDQVDVVEVGDVLVMLNYDFWEFYESVNWGFNVAKFDLNLFIEAESLADHVVVRTQTHDEVDVIDSVRN